MPSSRVIGVGAFVIGGLLLFAVGIFMIGERRLLFTKQIEAYTEFKRLAGLQKGATVRVSGMDAGEVLDIRVPSSPSAKFRVKTRIRADLQQLVRTDSVASIQTDGIVGNQFLQIEVGTEGAPPIADGGTIPGAEPFDLNAVLIQASDTVKNVNETVKELRGGIQVAVTAVTETATETQALISDVGADLKTMTRSGTKIAADTQEIVAGVREGRGSIGKLLNDDELHVRMTNMTKQAEQAVQNVREASEQAKEAVADLQSKNGPAQGIAADFRQTLSFTRDAMADLAENAEALKRNFLFRGFFNRRGFFDLQELSLAEYRAGALQAAGREPLRVWLDARVIFTTAPDGTEVLGDGAAARLDSVMSDVVRYPTDSPLVVEGYADGSTSAARFLRARARADLVSQYVVKKFSIDPRRITVMAMGSEAQNSPQGDRWDGVALALFVQKSALTRSVAAR